MKALIIFMVLVGFVVLEAEAILHPIQTQAARNGFNAAMAENHASGQHKAVLALSCQPECFIHTIKSVVRIKRLALSTQDSIRRPTFGRAPPSGSRAREIN